MDIKDLIKASGAKAVSFSLHYQEASGEWYGCVDSIGESENTITTDGTLERTIAVLIEYIKGL